VNSKGPSLVEIITTRASAGSISQGGLNFPTPAYGGEQTKACC
jgi:hypothetical protein